MHIYLNEFGIILGNSGFHDMRPQKIRKRAIPEPIDGSQNNLQSFVSSK